MEVASAGAGRCTAGCTGEGSVDPCLPEAKLRELVALARKLPLEVRAKIAAQVLGGGE